LEIREINTRYRDWALVCQHQVWRNAYSKQQWRTEVKNKPGGGMGSHQVHSSKSARKVEPRSQGIRPGAAAQIGRALGNHAQDAGAKKLNPVIPARTQGYNKPMRANVNAKPNVMARGTQGMHGPPAGKPAPQGRDIMNDFGRDSPIVSTRK
jgi:hypothetical protein